MTPNKKNDIVAKQLHLYAKSIYLIFLIKPFRVKLERILPELLVMVNAVTNL